MPATIWVGPVTDSLVWSFVALSATYYEDSPVNDSAVVRWRHVNAPGGPSTAVELRDDGATVGRMWIQVVPWWVNGKTLRAANPIDFLIREDHRTLPAFLSLFKAAMREALQRADLVFHTTNPITDDLYRKLLKLKPVTELDGAVLPVRPFAIATAATGFKARRSGRLGDAISALFVHGIGVLARLGRVRLADSASDSDQETVLRRFREEEAVCSARTPEHRAWRYQGAGVIRYETRWIFHGSTPVGFVVTTDREVNGIRGRFVVDLVWPGRPPRGRVAALWFQMAAEAAKARREAVFFFYNHANERLARLGGMPLLTVKRSRLPQRLPVFVRPSESSAHDLKDVDWAKGYFVLSDFDLF